MSEKISSVELIGPFQEEWRVCLDGYRVPKINAIPLTGAKDGRLSVCLDGRFLIECDRDEFDRWIWIVANAMAIGAGYSCFGENSVKDPNPFKIKMGQITDMPPPPASDE